MTWLRIDDGFAQHPKIVALSPRDRWTWLEVLCYCARYRTNGHLSAGVGEVVRGATPAFLERCVKLNLLDLSTENELGVDELSTGEEREGFRVHDWHDYNPAAVFGEELEERVRQAISEHPESSANELVKMLGTRRGATLEAIRRFRDGSAAGSAEAALPVPGYRRGNHIGNHARNGEVVPGTGSRAGAHARTRPLVSTTRALPDQDHVHDAAGAGKAPGSRKRPTPGQRTDT